MARRPSEEPHSQAHRRAQRKYRQTPQGNWVIRTDSFGVRPVDLVSRAPDRLKEFTTLDEAVRFEMACYEAKQHGADPAALRRVQGGGPLSCEAEHLTKMVDLAP